MIARCPKNPEHKRFITIAHVTEDWVVDERGEFIDVYQHSESEVVHRPHPENTWTCEVCGAQAEVKNVI